MTAKLSRRENPIRSNVSVMISSPYLSMIMATDHHSIARAEKVEVKSHRAPHVDNKKTFRTGVHKYDKVPFKSRSRMHPSKLK